MPQKFLKNLECLEVPKNNRKIGMSTNRQKKNVSKIEEKKIRMAKKLKKNSKC